MLPKIIWLSNLKSTSDAYLSWRKIYLILRNQSYSIAFYFKTFDEMVFMHIIIIPSFVGLSEITKSNLRTQKAWKISYSWYWQWKLTLKVRFWQDQCTFLDQCSAVLTSFWNGFIKFSWYGEIFTMSGNVLKKTFFKIRPTFNWSIFYNGCCKSHSLVHSVLLT